MVTVCIPVFNVDVSLLAAQLSEEIGALDVPVEVLFADDGSGEEFLMINRRIRLLPGITYVETGRNRGRAAIRNFLGQKAIHPWLLFLDADSLLPGEGFLKKYIDSLPTRQVICGGTAYQATPPEEKSTRLRWKYGIHREQLPAEERTRRNIFAITSNNFMISRELFLLNGFREEIREYGHEDTVLGYDLFRKGIGIAHIDNPVVHTGLETSAEYLKKTESALRNLLFISNKMISDPVFLHSSGLLRKLDKLDSFKLTGLAATCFRLFRPILKRSLTGACPKLFLFDLYRLGYLCLTKKTESVTLPPPSNP